MACLAAYARAGPAWVAPVRRWTEVRPSFAEALANLRRPLPPRRWLLVFARNLGLRLVHRQSCCGHPGEPGC